MHLHFRQIFSNPNILHYIGYFMLFGFAQEVSIFAKLK